MIIEILFILASIIIGIHVGIIGMGLSYYMDYSEQLTPLIAAFGLAFEVFLFGENPKIIAFFISIVIISAIIISIKDKFIVELNDQLIEKGIY